MLTSCWQLASLLFVRGKRQDCERSGATFQLVLNRFNLWDDVFWCVMMVHYKRFAREPGTQNLSTSCKLAMTCTGTSSGRLYCAFYHLLPLYCFKSLSPCLPKTLIGKALYFGTSPDRSDSEANSVDPAYQPCLSAPQCRQESSAYILRYLMYIYNLYIYIQVSYTVHVQDCTSMYTYSIWYNYICIFFFELVGSACSHFKSALLALVQIQAELAHLKLQADELDAAILEKEEAVRPE